ncbi:hypothetical protein SBF1_380010 [Candidatus Desulfosporosinus infrequens]|uniref:Uncharacterized protein n=1 Tax=Candidatus Desulfosporosinus infrequens TaxID=2043169 RepID=A0A2U3L5X9_9FIRM|nr:hypothetical protein SBF1_380010 [Candidatus Desulfosporosinus infrequens]
MNYQFTEGLLRHGISFEEAIRKQASNGFCVQSEENFLECLSTTMVEYKETRLFRGVIFLMEVNNLKWYRHSMN